MCQCMEEGRDMDRMPWTTYLWPGATQVWKHGAWSFLAVAVLFGLALNAALLSTLVWSELLPPNVRNLAWLAVAVIWVGFALYSHHWNQNSPAEAKKGSADDGFCAAQSHYLRGNWFEAQRILTGLVKDDPRDVDARLMLAALLRHTGRIEEAAQHLDYLQRLEGAGKWELEIGRERELLRAARSADYQETTSSPESPDCGAVAITKNAA